MMSAGTRKPAFFIWSPYGPINSGMNHQSATAMMRAAANPNGTRKRFMGLCSLRGRAGAATGGLEWRRVPGPSTLWMRTAAWGSVP
jgi:hypothetical protein